MKLKDYFAVSWNATRHFRLNDTIKMLLVIFGAVLWTIPGGVLTFATASIYNAWLFLLLIPWAVGVWVWCVLIWYAAEEWD